MKSGRSNKDLDGGRRDGGRPAGARRVPVNGYSERWLRQGFPWVYPAECTGARANAGEEVEIVAANGDRLGRGLADEGWIAVRRFRSPEGGELGPLDDTWLAARLDAAFALRRAVVPSDTTAWRLLHGENDELPGLRVDVWGGAPQGEALGRGAHLVISLDSPSLAGLARRLLPLLDARLAPASVHVAARPDPRDTTLRWPAGLVGLVAGEDPGEVEVLERGLRFGVVPGSGKDIGLYPDMRTNRRFLDGTWAGTRVLNLFAYTGAFSVFAAAGGAARVLSVDLSEAYLERAAANLARNGFGAEPGAPEPHPTLAEDCFRALDRLRRTGERFDRVVLDPPGHSHSDAGDWSGTQDYPRLAAAAMRVLAPGGWLIAASNVGTVSPKQFQGFLLEASRKVGRPVQLLHEGSAAPDFPAGLWFPEGQFLKFLVCRVY